MAQIMSICVWFFSFADPDETRRKKGQKLLFCDHSLFHLLRFCVKRFNPVKCLFVPISGQKKRQKGKN